jgi:hypothetical protein
MDNDIFTMLAGLGFVIGVSGIVLYVVTFF